MKQSLFSVLMIAAMSAIAGVAPVILAEQNRQAPANTNHYRDERQAVNSCPDDTVVWVNAKTGIYHFRGQRWYGRTISGFYECRRGANAEGDRASRSRQ